MSRTKLEYAPTSPLGWRPVFWVVAAGMMLLTMFMGLRWGIDQVNVPRTDLFAGTLRPERERAVVHLPAEVPLLSVLVEPGEEVRKGQTVALLDQAAIESRLLQIDRQIKSNAIFRECLLAPSGFAFDPGVDQGFDSETQLLIREGIDTCQSTLERYETRVNRMDDVRDLLRKRLSLLEKNLTLVLQQEDAAEPQAHQALEIALQKNRLHERLAQLDAEQLDARETYDEDRRTQQTSAAELVAQLRHQRAVLTRFKEAPRLTAPQKGTVARVRPLLAGNAYSESEDLIELHDERQSSFEAEFVVTLQQAHAMSEGMRVSLNLLGYREDGPILRGTVAAMQTDPDGKQVLAQVALDAESLERLADPAGGIALKGRSTASAISVSLADQSLAEALQNAVFQTVPTPLYQDFPARFRQLFMDHAL
ncbi:response regulator containing a CheY-like receiver domain and an HTH DNA-binding domain [Actibacterium atlanticum]|uniref:Response regulator containing a CheY-like receiver domain and an HTH DNA-binding domain n=1 Tax=Actibacterium atlanticum TaxID=1461693 RepID=A0A058ZM56_9RHOB|nr:hypothetical protein [Actibacterium atlanticum]KCV82257.1 response regulator containing a CheY-like receiver domain and an HTH DNA-binding domain [Actibacterium atlanticum]